MLRRHWDVTYDTSQADDQATTAKTLAKSYSKNTASQPVGAFHAAVPAEEGFVAANPLHHSMSHGSCLKRPWPTSSTHPRTGTPRQHVQAGTR